jgi:hypothetical protein
MSVNIKIEIVAGVEGNSCYINGRRVCGNKPWGGGAVIYKGETVIESIMQAIGVDCKDKLQSPWHSVADGDFPKGIKNDSECMSFIVKTKGGSQYFAYYTSWLDEEYRAIRHDFFDECDCLLDVEYWMKIPELPTE